MLEPTATGALVKEHLDAFLDAGEISALVLSSGEPFSDHDELSKLGVSDAVFNTVLQAGIVPSERQRGPWCAGIRYEQGDQRCCFHKDGSYVESNSEHRVKGTWRLDQDGKTVEITGITIRRSRRDYGGAWEIHRATCSKTYTKDHFKRYHCY